MTGHVGNAVAQVGATLTKEQLDQIIQEIARYEVNLEEDPTQPQLGTAYLQKIISKCRAYQNRVQYYLQIVKLYEKKIKLDLRMRELDLDFKMREKLADDPIVRKQASVRDREALASTMLRQEYEIVANLKVDLMDVEETVKLIRSKYDQLKQTSNDIRMQRVLIKDDKESQMIGGEGYSSPQAAKNRAVANGMPAPIVPRVDPQDLLDPKKRPDDFPEPIDEAHASMMAGFLNSHPAAPPTTWTCEECFEEVPLNPTFPLICSKQHRAVCSVCGDQQFFSPSGPYCKVHSGTTSKMVVPEGTKTMSEPEPTVPQAKTVSYGDLLD